MADKVTHFRPLRQLSRTTPLQFTVPALPKFAIVLNVAPLASVKAAVSVQITTPEGMKDTQPVALDQALLVEQVIEDPASMYVCMYVHVWLVEQVIEDPAEAKRRGGGGRGGLLGLLVLFRVIKSY